LTHSDDFLPYLVFALVVAGLVTLVGLGLGAHFNGDITTYLAAVGFLLMAVVAAAGIGLILAAFINSVQGAAFIGLALVLILAFVSGIFVPYSSLSAPLQVFSRVFPISSATSSVCYLLLGQDVAGYNPITLSQMATTGVLALALLVIGLVLYHRTNWHQDSGISNRLPRGYLPKRHGPRSGA
jgi:ABC-2 type transport system permease protein